ncbi:hypothetical protein PoB_001198700 [Plakobranchus ocellatus]|uniref:Uncharacterized protein n=1 Tax=Plakobranchus ocellatus TaxID=259542 RepID=A0AAV3YSP6_9GAST|nr:hypothetical protein PoB_001198700 [Plakobranchus ocellatus]
MSSNDTTINKPRSFSKSLCGETESIEIQKKTVGEMDRFIKGKAGLEGYQLMMTGARVRCRFRENDTTFLTVEAPLGQVKLFTNDENSDENLNLLACGAIGRRLAVHLELPGLIPTESDHSANLHSSTNCYS